MDLDVDVTSLDTNSVASIGESGSQLGLYLAFALCIVTAVWWLVYRTKSATNGLRIEAVVSPVDRAKGLQDARDRLVQQAALDLERERVLERGRQAELLSKKKADQAARLGALAEGGQVTGHAGSRASPYQPDDIAQRLRYTPYTTNRPNPVN
jgi:hypothetical protein